MEGDSFAGQPDNAFHVHDTNPRGANGHDVSTPRVVEMVDQSIDEIDAVIFVSGHHALALNSNWNEHESVEDD